MIPTYTIEDYEIMKLSSPGSISFFYPMIDESLLSRTGDHCQLIHNPQLIRIPQLIHSPAVSPHT